jgi:hypothetical protein
VSLTVQHSQFGWLGFPVRGDAAFLDRLLLRRRIALLGSRDEVSPMIWPFMARNPALVSAASERLNKALIAGTPSMRAMLSASRKFQFEFASGTRSVSVSPRKRMNDRRSWIRYFVRSSDSKWPACEIKTLYVRT